MRGEPDVQLDPRLDRLLAGVQKRLLVRRAVVAGSRNLLAVLLLVLPAAAVSAFRGGPHPAEAAGALCAAALLAAVAEALVRRPGRLEAALHVDGRFGLDERLSTLVSVAAADVPPDMLAALMQDTLNHARHIRAATACPVSLPRSAPFTGAALFVAAALIFGPASAGSAGHQGRAVNELRDMTVKKSYARAALPADLQDELAKLAGPGGDLDEALARLDKLLGAFEALEGIRESADEPEVTGLTVEELEAALKRAPDARKRLEAVLDRAARRLGSDPELRAAVEQAAKALDGGDEQAVAKALSELIDKLAEVTGRHQLGTLTALKERLAPPARPDDAEGGVGRGITSGGTVDGESGEAPFAPLFPRDAALDARAAVETESVPARYRWAVERYFAEE